MRRPRNRSSRTDRIFNREMSPDEHRRVIASLLAKGVLRWHRKARSDIVIPTPESSGFARTGLDFCGETRLSVVESTRKLGMRDDGDAA